MERLAGPKSDIDSGLFPDPLAADLNAGCILLFVLQLALHASLARVFRGQALFDIHIARDIVDAVQ